MSSPPPYFTDESTTLYHGDSLAILQQLPDASVDCCVTSPPYFGLRDYGEAGQYGLESSPAEYVETMRAVFAEVRRVLADDGTLWLNIGDSYSGQLSRSAVGMPGLDSDQNPCPSSLSAQSPQYPSQPSPYSENDSEQSRQVAINGSVGPLADMRQGARNGNRRSRPRGYEGLPAKNLMGIPWRTAFALQGDGWILRNDIIWNKPNAMPESVTDRLSTRHEHLFMFSKSRAYWFDLDPIREPVTTTSATALTWARDSKEADVPGQSMRQHRGDRTPYPGMPPQGIKAATGRQHVSDYGNGGKNPGDVWTVPTQPFAEAHFAVMPQTLAERAILAGCKPGGVVLDPFSGSGTTGLAAAKHGRRYVGIDLNADYLNLSLRTRLAQPGLNFGEATA
jgi:DNA modification methylase